jgi:hypothetical protein
MRKALSIRSTRQKGATFVEWIAMIALAATICLVAGKAVFAKLQAAGEQGGTTLEKAAQ